MNAAALHLAINHLPVVGILLATIAVAWAYYKNQTDLTDGALLLTALVAVLALPVFMSGEPAEEFLKTIQLLDIDGTRIERHEWFATFALITIEAAGGFALITYFQRRHQNQAIHDKRLLILVMVSCIVATAIMMRTAQLGGQIHHSEAHEANR